MEHILSKEEKELIRRIRETEKNYLDVDGWECETSEYNGKHCLIIFNNDIDDSFLVDYEGGTLTSMRNHKMTRDLYYYAELEGCAYRIAHGSIEEFPEDVDNKIDEVKVRFDFTTALEQVEEGYELAHYIDWGLSKEDLSNLAIIYRDREDLQDKILSLMEDCNFHSESRDFYYGNYNDYILNEEDKKPMTPKEKANMYLNKYGSEALERYKADNVDYKKMTPDEQKTYGIINSQVKREEFNEKLAQGINTVFEDDNFKRWLKFSNSFPDYSFNNIMLIAMQCPKATAVKSASSWAEDGVRIKKEFYKKGILISVPLLKEFNAKNEDEFDKELGKLKKFLDNQVSHHWMTIEESDYYLNKFKEAGKVKILNGYRYDYTYDISMTDCTKVPENELRQELNLSLDNFDDIKSILWEISKENGVNITYASEDNGKLDNAYGYFTASNNEIVVRGTDYKDEPRSQADVIRTTIHEMAHSMLHGKEMLAKGVDSNDKTISRSAKEIEAEGVALMVCEHLGFDSGANSYGYMASYLPEDEKERAKALKESTDKILKCSAEIIARFDEKYQHLQFLYEDDRLSESDRISTAVETTAEDIVAEDIVKINCYYKEKEMPREQAIKFYMNCLLGCDPQSSEAGRYVCVLQGLQSGLKVVFDDMDEQIKYDKEHPENDGGVMQSFSREDTKIKKSKGEER